MTNTKINSFMAEAVIISMDWFLHDNGLRYERVKKQLPRRKLVASFREAISNVFLYLFLPPLHVAPSFLTTINYFLPPLKQELISSLVTFVRLLYGIFVYKVSCYWKCFSFLTLSLLISSITDRLYCTGQNNLTSEK